MSDTSPLEPTPKQPLTDAELYAAVVRCTSSDYELTPEEFEQLWQKRDKEAKEYAAKMRQRKNWTD